MANYELMIFYINSVDKDIRLLEGHQGSKLIVKTLIKLQEFSRDAWAKIHSIVKTMENATPAENNQKTQDIINACFHMNMKINDFYDKIVNICLKKGDDFFLNYVMEEMFYCYSIFLDALHFMGIYYIPAESFPFALSNSFAVRKMLEIKTTEEDDQSS